MTDYVTSEKAAERREGEPFSLGAWVGANVVGLGSAYGLFALLGDLAEFGLGVPHDSLIRNIALMIGVLIGATIFVMLRRRILAPHTPNSTWAAVSAGTGLAIGLIAGFGIGGPPFDFMLGVFALGTIGGALQWRALKDRIALPGGLILASIGGWILAAIAVGLVAFLAVEPLLQLFGVPLDASADGTVVGTVSFILILTLLGVVGGAVGGLIEGRALRRRLSG